MKALLSFNPIIFNIARKASAFLAILKIED